MERFRELRLGTEQSRRTKGATTGGLGWDWLNINRLSHHRLHEHRQFNLNLLSLTSLNSAGNVIDFNSSVNTSYTIASASGGISGFDPSRFSINAGGFSNDSTRHLDPLPRQRQHRPQPRLTAAAIPEPATSALLAALAILGIAVHRRRKNQ